MNLVDVLCRGTQSQEEAAYRATTFDLCVAQTTTYGSMMKMLNPKVRLYEYICPTLNRSVNLLIPQEITTGYYDLSDMTKRETLVDAINWRMVQPFQYLDGIMIDVPFDCPPGQEFYSVRFVAELQNAISPKVVCVNFGDWLTWTNTGNYTASRKMAQAQMAFLARSHFVQNGIDAGQDDALGSRYDYVAPWVEKRLASKKEVIIGVVNHAGFALTAATAAFALSLRFPEVGIYYEASGQSPIPPEMTPEQLFHNPYYRLVGR